MVLFLLFLLRFVLCFVVASPRRMMKIGVVTMFVIAQVVLAN